MERQRALSMLCLWVVFLGGAACAGPAAEIHAGSRPTAAKDGDEEAQTDALAPSSPPATLVTSANFPPPLPARMDAGEIHREDLLATLEAGVPRFLSQLDVKAETHQGRFVGWRLMAIRHERGSDFVLRPGDLVLRINNQGLERPEQFMQVWESLQGATEIVFEIVRGDQPSAVRFAITDQPLPVTHQFVAPAG